MLVQKGADVNFTAKVSDKLLTILFYLLTIIIF